MKKVKWAVIMKWYNYEENKWHRHTTKWYDYSGDAWKEAEDFGKTIEWDEMSRELAHKEVEE